MQFRDLNKKHGFTAVEILFVVVLIGILTALAVKPVTGLLQRIKIQNAADGVRRLLLNARVRAVSNSQRHCGVSFVLSNGTAPTDYDYAFAFFDQAPPNADNVYNVGDTLYGAKFKVSRGDKIKMTLVPATTADIVFRGDGSANTGLNIVLTLNNYVDTVNVLPSTGRVKVIVK